MSQAMFLLSVSVSEEGEENAPRPGNMVRKKNKVDWKFLREQREPVL